MPKVSFDSQDKGDRCLELALAVRLSRVSRRKKDDFAHSENCKLLGHIRASWETVASLPLCSPANRRDRGSTKRVFNFNNSCRLPLTFEYLLSNCLKWKVPPRIGKQHRLLSVVHIYTIKLMTSCLLPLQGMNNLSGDHLLLVSPMHHCPIANRPMTLPKRYYNKLLRERREHVNNMAGNQD